MVELVSALPQLGVYPVLPATTLTTSGTPSTYDGTPAVVGITTGGTAGNELIDVALPDLPIDAWFNPYLIGLRVIFCLVTQTDPGDVVVITAGGEGEIDFYPARIADQTKGVSAGVTLDYQGACVCFVWCGEQWLIDDQLTSGEFSGPYRKASAGVDVDAPNSAQLRGSALNIQGPLPTEDPMAADQWYSDAGVVKISAGA